MYTNYHIQKFNTLLFIDTPYIDDTFKPYGYYQELVTDEELSNPERLDALYDEEQAKESLDIDDYEDEDDPDNDVCYFENKLPSDVLTEALDILGIPWDNV